MPFAFARTALILAALATAPLVQAAPLAVGGDDTVSSLIQAQKGNKVTLRLTSGEEISGTVVSVSKNVIHLSAVTGREMFDAAVNTAHVTAVLVRTK